MNTESHVVAICAASRATWDAFAGFDDWKQQGDRMVSPSGKRSLTLPVFERLKRRSPKGNSKGARPYPFRATTAAILEGLSPAIRNSRIERRNGVDLVVQDDDGYGEFTRAVSPAEAAALVKGGYVRDRRPRPPKSAPKKAKSAAPKAKVAPLPKGQPKPGEAERYAAAKAQIAQESYEAAKRLDPTNPELAILKARADAATAQLKAPAKPNPTLPLSSLPSIPADPVAEAQKRLAAAKPGTADSDRAKAALVKAKRQAAKANSVTVPEFDPNKKTADSTAVIRRTPTTVQGKPIVATPQTNRAGESSAKITAQQAAKPTPNVPTKPDGSPDLPALKKSVESGIVTNRAMNWGYETTAAKAALKAASKQIDDYARQSPRKIATLAREVTGKEPDSTEDGVKLLKEWVSETLDLLERKPDPPRKKPGVTRNGERVSWFAERRDRLATLRHLCAALAA